MIQLKKVSKKYNNRYVLKNVSINFPRNGLVVINGPSGCGKSTLMYILASLLDFHGEIQFDGVSYRKMDKNERDNFRNKKIGFVFQDYKLFENETVKKNILLAINLGSNDSESKKDKRIKDLLGVVSLSNKENELVSNLSGGEKQRVAIARAIANSPKVVLADEPTGNLDEANTKNIMELLTKIASSNLVIMVSHDLEISEAYADEIITMSDGKVIKHKYLNRNKKEESLPVLKLKYKENKLSIPFSFLFSHTLNSIKRRRWRTMFITASTSLGLIGVGLASTLREIISTNLVRSYSSIIDSDRLILSNKNPSISKDLITSMNYEEVTQLIDENENIDDVGSYYCNASTLFPTENYLILDLEGSKKPIGNFNSTSVNEFALLSSYKGDVYPNKPDTLQDNEIVLSMPMLVISDICYQLQIPRTIDSLSTYIEHFDLNASFIFSNSEWNYSVTIPLKIKGFILSTKSVIYHTNKLWNEYIFESQCSLPITHNINTNSGRPWDLKKVYYLTFKNHREDFIKKYRFNLDKQDYDFEILDSKYYQTLFKGVDTNDCNRLGCFKRTNRDDLYSYIGEYCKKASKSVRSVIYGSSNGYAIYDQSLMMGFSKSTYLSSNLEYITDISEQMSYVKYEDAYSINIPNEIVEGHFSKSQFNGFIFEPNYNLIQGNVPSCYQDIVISIELAKKLNLTNPINKTIYLSFPSKENLLNNGYLSRDYKTVELKISGISNSSKLSISHDEAWSILFFQTMLGVSSFDLRINNLAIQVSDGNESEVIDKISRAFPFINVTAPLKEAKSSIDRICSYIETIMIVVSITSVIIASLILLLCNYLHVIEIKKDVGLLRCLGVREKESRKFIYFHSLTMTFLSFITSSIELLVTSFILSKVMAASLYIESSFIFNPLSFLYMFATALVISLVSSLFTSRKVSKLNPLECLV